MAVCGSCSRAPCSCVPTASPAGCPPGRGPDFPQAPANTPPPISSLACTFALSAQAGIDNARKTVHALGLRPYKVRLVWQRQDDFDHDWIEDASLELMPVEVRDFETVALIIEQAGQKPDGIINLREVSPRQVDEWTLRGYRNGEPWGDDTATREFFYEVQHIGLCPADAKPRTYRFTLAGAPVLRTDRHEWQVKLTTQLSYRTPELEDQTVADEGFEDARLLA